MPIVVVSPPRHDCHDGGPWNGLHRTPTQHAYDVRRKESVLDNLAASSRSLGERELDERKSATDAQKVVGPIADRNQSLDDSVQFQKRLSENDGIQPVDEPKFARVQYRSPALKFTGMFTAQNRLLQ
jgi:hypothetical protein